MKTYESKITLFPSQHLVEKSKKKNDRCQD